MTNPGAARKGDKQRCDVVNVVKPEVVKCWVFKTPAETVPHVGGPILTGSPDVNVDGRPAARVADSVDCTPAGDHSAMIGTGASQVRINGRLAARVGSKTSHRGSVQEGSTDVLVGSDEAAGSVGDDTDATAACRTAATQRQNGQQQEGQNSCGQESVRTLCILKCQREKLPASSPACQAAQTSEKDWYIRYLGQEKDTYNASNAADREAVTKYNDARWAEVKAAAGVSRNRDSGGFKPGDSWVPEQGQTLFLHKSESSASAVTRQITIKRLPVIDDPAKVWNNGGYVGSNADGRARFLESQCGIKASAGENSVPGIAADVGNGKTVVASVDVGVLNGREQEGAHAVIVSKVEFAADGSIKGVTIVDTAPGGGCKRVVDGATFQKALNVDRPSNVV